MAYEHPEVASLESLAFPQIDDLTEREAMREALWRMFQHPPRGSEEIQAFAYVARECLEDTEINPRFSRLVDVFNQSRQDLDIEQRAHLLRIGFQYVLMEAGVDYPENGARAEQWHAWFNYVLDNRFLKAQLEDALWSYRNQANIPKRYAGVKIALAAHKNLFPSTIDIVDAGTSAGLGMVQLKENLHFDNVRVRAGEHIRMLVHAALQLPLEIDRAIGFDLQPGNKFWVEACSYDPPDLKIERLRKFRERLFARTQTSGVKVFLADITADEQTGGIAEVREQFPEGKADAVTAITMLYQIDPAHREAAIFTLESMGKTLAIVQDSAEIHRKDPTKLVFRYKDIYAPSSHYNLYAKVLSEPDQPYVKLGTTTFRGDVFTPTRKLVQMLSEQLAA